MSGGRLAHNAVYRPLAHGGIVFCNNAHKRTYYQSYDDGTKDTHLRKLVSAENHGFRKQVINKEIGRYCRNNNTSVVTQVKCTLNVGGRCTVVIVYFYEQSSKHGEDDAST